MASPRKSAKTVAPVAQPEPVTFAYSLESVIEATLNSGFVYTSAEFHNPLIESGDVEVNPELVNENGEVATRATAKHLPAVAQPEPETESVQMTETSTPAVATVAATATPRNFAIKLREMPTITRKSSSVRAGRTPIYPFDQLGLPESGTAYESFFVADSGEKSAVTSLASTVSGANARYSVEIDGQTRVNRKGKTVPVTRQLRKFKAVEGVEIVDGVEVKGAFVFRLPVDAE